ncbi:6-phospho-alpha-glucosidase [Clostridium sp. BJN0001]|uniref:6-phospho-alpha-glucosidase n=1 Tax=Clostridium sp. BJN0001 TaxID=2930219 RepID=UPI001FD2E6A4|nr:6-phospho-alpha-glucosidase [Clostridium sp. BJN0001]
MKKFNVVIVGGGSTFTPGFLKSFVRIKDKFPLKKLVLFDIDKERQEPIGAAGKILFKEYAPEVEFSYTTDPKEAYTDMDFVFMQMRVGKYAMREKDEKIPLKMGLIGQETVGAGGFAYGLRSTKEMIKAIYDLRKYSKDAWVLNYSNPAAIVAEALRREFPNDTHILNICDQPENIIRSASRSLNCDYNIIDPVYFGLNHYGWFTHLYNKETGEDLLPKLKKIIHERGFLPQDAEQRDQSWLDTYGFVQQMLEDFPDYLPNSYDQYYLYQNHKLSILNPDFTRTNEIQEGREKRVFEEAREVIAKGTTKGILDIHEDAHAEFMIEVAMSIAYNRNNRYIVIVENNGAISNMDDDAMVEVAAELGFNGPRPLGVGKIPTFYKGLLEQQVASEKLLIDAYYEHSYVKALQALTLNRLINDAEKAKEVLDKLIEANKDYFPPLN